MSDDIISVKWDQGAAIVVPCPKCGNNNVLTETPDAQGVAHLKCAHICVFDGQVKLEGWNP